jgi:ubiquinone/menaquinone biosynthesis C-methylase UbiE
MKVILKPFIHSRQKWIVIILVVFSIFWLQAKNQSGVLKPENANEARLNRLQPPKKVMDAIGVSPGMAVAEIGAGRGRYVVQLAVRVGETGRVYAEDIDARALLHLKKRCQKWGLTNVQTILGEVTDPKLPENELDLIFIISSYHHFDDPVTLLRNARSSLKPAGILAIAEWLPFKRSQEKYATPRQLKAQVKAAGYRFIRTDPLLEQSNMLIYIFSSGN